MLSRLFNFFCLFQRCVTFYNAWGNITERGIEIRRVILDTNIYGEIIREGIQDVLKERFESLKAELAVYGLGIIRKELRDVPRKKRKGRYSFRIAVLNLYDYLTSGHEIVETPLAKSLAVFYFKEYRKNEGALGWEKMKNDLIIIAQATLSRIDIVASEDCASMCSEKAVVAYRKVNKMHNFYTPEFISYGEFKRLFSL